MKIAVIVKTDLNNAKAYTTHRSKVTYHTDKLFLSQTDKNAIQYGLDWVEAKGGEVDAYTFEQGVLADRVLHEALAMGVKKAVKFTGVDFRDPLQGNSIAKQFANYLKKQGGYDLVLTGANDETDALSAFIAADLGYSYQDHVSKIDTKFMYETELEKGHIRGQFKMPAVITVLDSINTPHLPSFIDLRNALQAKIKSVSLHTDPKQEKSQIVADQSKRKQIIFDLHQDPEAIQKLVDVLKQDGILK